jgi:hypothetical protein
VLAVVERAPAPVVLAIQAQPARAVWPARVLLLLVLLVGLGVRLHGLDNEPLTFHPARQYRSALIARADFLDHTRPTSDPPRIQADTEAALQGHLEPEIMESVTAVGFRVLGHDSLVLPRLLASLVWLLAAVAVWGVLRRMTGLAGQVAGTLTFVLLPLGVEGGRSFQPDALMVALMAWTLLALLRHDDHPRLRRLAIAGGVACLAGVVKPMALPMIGAAFVALAWRRRQSWRSIVNRQTAVFAVMACGGAVCFYAYAAARHASVSNITYFAPALLFRLAFYRAWWHMVAAVIGVPAVVACVLGAFLAGRWRGFVVALVAGYLAFGAIVDYRTETHSYYHLQLLIPVAIGVGVLAGAIARHAAVRASTPRRLTAAVLGLVLALALLRGALGGQPTVVATQMAAPAIDRQIGVIAGSKDLTVTITADYGVSLAWYGRVNGFEFPSVLDDEVLRLAGRPVPSVAASLDQQVDGRRARWLVVTSWANWESLPDLRAWAQAHATQAAAGPGWVVYRLPESVR